MNDWRIQQRVTMNSIGPIRSYHSIRSRSSPYQIHDTKQAYHYQQSPTVSVKTDPNSNIYNLPHSDMPTHIERIQHQQSLITRTRSTLGSISTYHPGQQQIMAARAHSMPYPSPSMHNHSSGSVCQCNLHTHYPSQHPIFYRNCYQTQSISCQQNPHTIKYETMKNPIPLKCDEVYPLSSTSYHPSIYSNSYISTQQTSPQSSTRSQEYSMYSNQCQIFPSPPSNPSTPYQSEFNGNTECGVPYHQSQPSSVNSLTDALCPNGDTTECQLPPGTPSVSTPLVASYHYSFPQTPLTPTTSRLTNGQNMDELTAFLYDPINTHLTDDLASTLFDDIETLAETYLGGRGNAQQINTDNNLDYDIILNYLCSDDLISTVYKKSN